MKIWWFVLLWAVIEGIRVLLIAAGVPSWVAVTGGVGAALALVVVVGRVAETPPGGGSAAPEALHSLWPEAKCYRPSAKSTRHTLE